MQNLFDFDAKLSGYAKVLDDEMHEMKETFEEQKLDKIHRILKVKETDL